MINYIAYFVVIIIVISRFISSYQKGLLTSIFFLVLLPTNLTVTFHIMLPSLTIHRAIILILTFFWFRNSAIDKRLKGIRFLKMQYIIVLALGISTIISPFLVVSLKRFLYFFIESVLFFIILRTSLNDRDIIERIFKTVAMALLVVCILGVIEKYTGYNPSDNLGSKMAYEFNQIAGSGSRVMARDVQSTYLHRILFGIAAAISFVYFTFLADMAKKSKSIMYLLYIFISGAGLYFSNSRGPWLALIVGIIFICFFRLDIIFKKILLILLCVIFVFIARPGTWDTIETHFTSTMDSSTVKGGSFRWRFIVLNVAYDRISTTDSLINLLFGFGPASHVFLDFGSVELSTGYVTELESWDCEFAVILLENGIIGLALLLLFYFYIFLKCRMYYVRNKTNREYILLYLTVLCIFIFMKTNVKIFAPQLVYLEFICIANLSALITGSNTPRSRDNRLIIDGDNGT